MFATGKITQRFFPIGFKLVVLPYLNGDYSHYFGAYLIKPIPQKPHYDE